MDKSINGTSESLHNRLKLKSATGDSKNDKSIESKYIGQLGDSINNCTPPLLMSLSLGIYEALRTESFGENTPVPVVCHTKLLLPPNTYTSMFTGNCPRQTVSGFNIEMIGGISQFTINVSEISGQLPLFVVVNIKFANPCAVSA